MHPVLFDWGPLRIHSYGLMVAAGFAAAMLLARRRISESPFSFSRLLDFGVALLIGGLAGGRLLYVVMNAAYFRVHPWEMLMIHHGGLSYFGALAGGLAAGVWFIRRIGAPFWEAADFMIIWVPLAHAVGRVGCFLNGCCWGTASTVPWAVKFPHLGYAAHPTQLYEALANLALFGLMQVIFKRKLFAGQALLSYGVLYGTTRFLLEFLRGDSPHAVLGFLTPFQVMAAFLVVVSLAAWAPLALRSFFPLGRCEEA
ncbi:MAG: prolipoprotein diacylglyceryl transferase [Candidatus Omnitrophica bacterium]|nr:prolipoprotein diacylglyceryl transferase [Candidatus Omnitrophota bacterium]